jgi:branched-subunit amino acid aminotransferase/4-amino-4-deoxychorismate lyase
MATVFLNGAFMDGSAARVSAFDAGLQHGVGVFETMVGGVGTRGAWAHRVEEHVSRLLGSARELGLSDRLNAAGLCEAVLATVARCGLERARVRLTVTGGDLNLLSGSGGGTSGSGLDPTILIVAQAAPEYPAVWFEEGVVAVVSDLRLNPLEPSAGHKTLNYWPRLRELRSAAAKHAGEGLVFSVTNHLAGGCVSNAFVVKGDGLQTPIARGEEGGGGVAIPSPVLPGIARAATIEWAGRVGMGVARRMISIRDVLEADELFLTNSGWGVLPVVRVDEKAIGTGKVGDVARRARAAWLSDEAAARG